MYGDEPRFSTPDFCSWCHRIRDGINCYQTSWAGYIVNACSEVPPDRALLMSENAMIRWHPSQDPLPRE